MGQDNYVYTSTTCVSITFPKDAIVFTIQRHLVMTSLVNLVGVVNSFLLSSQDSLKYMHRLLQHGMHT